MKNLNKPLQSMSSFKRHYLSASLIFLFVQNSSFAQSPGGVSTNLATWFKANASVFKDAGSTSAANGDSVQQWNDKSGNGYNASNAGNIQYSALPAGDKTGVKPIFYTNKSNFNPSLSFGGSSTVSELNLGANFPSASSAQTGYSIFVVANPTKSNSYNFIVDVGHFANNGIGLGLGTTGANAYNPANYGGTGSTGISSSTSVNTSTLLRFITPFGSSAQNSVLYQNSISKVSASTTVQFIQANGSGDDISWSSTYGTGNPTPPEYTPFVIGRQAKAGNGSYLSRYFTGDINEILIYSSALSATQINQIESYLALKYGITLGSTSSLVNYVSSNSTKFWTGSSTYQHDVFGIGTDNGSGLTQTKSNSMNTGSGNGIGQSTKGNLVLSSATALANQQFLMIGDDAGTLTEETTNLPSGSSGSKRLVRNWLVQNTGSVGTVNLSFDMSGLTLSGGTTASNYRLLVNSNTDATFATGTPTHYYASSITGNLINFTGISLNNNTVFTLVTYASGSTLPAIWQSFTASKLGNGASLNWATSNEVNVGYYEVEQSADGSSYLSLGRVAANNASTDNYSFQTGSLLDGPNYFRIKRVDLDGNFGYSAVRIIDNSEPDGLNIEPNPVFSNTLKMKIKVSQTQAITISIIGLNGRLIQNKMYTVEKGDNYVEMDISHLADGAYIATSIIGNNLITQKFIKQ
ncbi:MAG: T9SS type A sorting domain-containing protein [Bacteroidetes bacterium]|nr:T9SS type A sorting domain-containing protein [Bacteroidota bacterium]